MGQPPSKEVSMKRVAQFAALLSVLALVAAGVAGGAPDSRHGPTKLTVWVGWSAGNELTSFKKLAAEYEGLHKDVKLSVVGGIVDTKIVAAIRAGTAPDVVSSFNSYNVGIYCGTGAWIDLNPLLKQSNISSSIFPPVANYYPQYGGKKCALPLLADAYGLYYHNTLIKKA